MDGSLALFVGWVALSVALFVVCLYALFRPDEVRRPLLRLAVLWVAVTVVFAVVARRTFHTRPEPVAARPAPNFALRTLDGSLVSKRSLRGKVVLLEFWATWCPPCRESLPEMIQLYRELSTAGLEIVGISEDHDQNQLEAFIAQKGIRWPQYWDADGKLAETFHTQAVPSYIVLDREGRIFYEQRGWNELTMLRLREAIRAASLLHAQNAATVSTPTSD